METDSTQIGAHWVDTHCHLDSLDDPAAAVDEARGAGVAAMVTIGTDVASSRRAVEIAAAHDGVWAAVGVHPHDAASLDDAALAELRRLAASPKVAAIGEIGLDYHRDSSPREAQREAFVRQLDLAEELGKAVVIHMRDAHEDLFSLLERRGPPGRLVFHCFSGGAAEAGRALDLGGFLSFAGNVSFKNAHDLRKAAAAAPLDRLLVETDAPYLAPMPHRGRPNRPAWAALVGEALAAAVGAAPEDLGARTAANAARVFGLPALR